MTPWLVLIVFIAVTTINIVWLISAVYKLETRISRIEQQQRLEHLL